MFSTDLSFVCGRYLVQTTLNADETERDLSEKKVYLVIYIGDK